MKTPLHRFVALAAIIVTPGLFAYVDPAEASARVDATVSEVKGDAAKAALEQLGGEIDRVEAQIDNAPTPEEKAAVRIRLDALKQRRSELRKTYVQARYNELKADVRAEAARVAAWSKRTFSSTSAETAADRAHAVGDQAYAAATSAAAAVDLAIYKLRPTDTNKAEAKAAMKALDQKIAALDEQADRLPRGPERDAAQRRVKALDARRDELQHEFNKARFDALVDSVQAEWHQLVH